MAWFGELMLYVCALLSAAGGALCLARGRERRYFDISASFLVAAAAAGAVVLLSLVFLLVTHDYRVEYVREYADRTMSLGYLFTAVWGGQQGSLLLWAILQTWFSGAAALWLGRKGDLSRAPAAFGFLAALQVFFLMLVLFHSNPFEPLGTTATAGIGLNPLLRNAYMASHPPTLYLGFVGFSIPMAFALSALVDGDSEGGWLVALRPWILVAWVFLGVGNVLGMVWAYEELGWGGYWGWDPVENAAFMPWLTATALLHSSMAQERRGVLRRWNILLIIVTFALIVFGTFLTRSGVIESVHAFAGATTGPYFLALIAVTGVAGVALLIARSRRLRPARALGPMLSRGWSLAVGNWVFLAAAAFVWVATMMPFFTDLLFGEKVTMTPEFFNRWMVPIGMVVLVLLAVCTLFEWKVPEGAAALRRAVVPVLAGVLAAAWGVLLGAVRPELGGAMAFAPAFSIGAMAFAGIALLMAMRRTILASRDEGRAGTRRRLGGQLVHASMLLMFLGFTGSAFTTEAQGSMGPGDFMNVAGYRIDFTGLRADTDFEREAVFADLAVRGPDGGDLGVMSPARFSYFSHPGRPTSEVVIDTGAGGDLFLVLGDTDQRGRAVIKAVVNPMVLWIWIGGVLMVIGTIVALLRPGAVVELVELSPAIRSRYGRHAAGLAIVAVAAAVSGALYGLPAVLTAAMAALLLGCLYGLAAALRGLAAGGGEG